jgi:hypothetical protein
MPGARSLRAPSARRSRKSSKITASPPHHTSRSLAKPSPRRRWLTTAASPSTATNASSGGRRSSSTIRTRGARLQNSSLPQSSASASGPSRPDRTSRALSPAPPVIEAALAASLNAHIAQDSGRRQRLWLRGEWPEDMLLSLVQENRAMGSVADNEIREIGRLHDTVERHRGHLLQAREALARFLRGLVSLLAPPPRRLHGATSASIARSITGHAKVPATACTVSEVLRPLSCRGYLRGGC